MVKPPHSSPSPHTKRIREHSTSSNRGRPRLRPRTVPIGYWCDEGDGFSSDMSEKARARLRARLLMNRLLLTGGRHES